MRNERRPPPRWLKDEPWLLHGFADKLDRNQTRLQLTITAKNDPGQTGCAFADRILLPAMRSSGRFVDQEAVQMSKLQPGQGQTHTGAVIRQDPGI